MAEVLNKKELAEKLADEFELTKKAAGEQIQFLLDVVASELEKGNTVDLSGFGKFVVKEKAAHEGINPATMEKITIAAKKAVAFKPAKALKENVK
ncbi:MAG: HU family DNA-binding protein [Erysipelotrichaceae bacterium]|nr:HU family DNA-binding protein [Erysipelotrichaceae bacterium]